MILTMILPFFADFPYDFPQKQRIKKDGNLTAQRSGDAQLAVSISGVVAVAEASVNAGPAEAQPPGGGLKMWCLTSNFCSNINTYI